MKIIINLWDRRYNMTKKIIHQTQYWLDNVIIAHNICPFAKRERDKGGISFVLEETSDVAQALENLLLECQRLDENPAIETILLIFSQIGQDFYQYLDFLDIANQLLIDQTYEGVYQLASFHPDYCFSGSEEDDPANFTNRSPHPTIHIIREASLTSALQHYKNPENIPKRNIQYCQKLGLQKMQQMWSECLKQ
jgi:hypothetical protein